MPWGRLDDSLYDHPKLDLIPVEDRLAAIGLWARSISWCNRFLTDGVVPRDRVVKLDGTIALADQLVVAGLFEVSQNEYLIHDFLAFNDAREKVLERRQRDADRQAKWRADRDAENRGKPPAGAGHSVTPRTKRAPVTAESHAESRRDKGGESQSESQRDSRTRESRPDPSRPITPNPRQAGADGKSPRANGTNPRAVAQAEQQRIDEEAEGRKRRRNQRHLAYLRGSINGDQQADMDRRDAPLEEIPDWAAHVERGRVEQESEGVLAEAWRP